MSYTITAIEGIGPAFGEKLSGAGVTTVDHLLEHGANPSGRASIARTTGIEETKILKWVNMADLFRVHGVGSEYAELLEAAGVDTVKELRNRNAENLHMKLEEVNQERKLVRKTPSVDMVKSFIEDASKLEPVVTY